MFKFTRSETIRNRDGSERTVTVTGEMDREFFSGVVDTLEAEQAYLEEHANELGKGIIKSNGRKIKPVPVDETELDILDELCGAVVVPRAHHNQKYDTCGKKLNRLSECAKCGNKAHWRNMTTTKKGERLCSNCAPAKKQKG